MLPADTARAAILGVPLNPGKQPSPSGVVRAFEEMDARILANSAGALVVNAHSDLSGLSSPAANIMVWVMSGSQAGVYQNTGTSGSPAWTKRADLPYGVIKAINVGAGTANAIVATSAIPVPSADGAALITLPIVAANDASPVTVAFNGGSALTIKSNTGNDIAIGGLQAGMLVLGFKSGSTFRIVTDQVSSAIIAQAEAYALAAANSAGAAEAAAALAKQRYIRVHVIDTEGGDPETDYEADDEIDGVTLVAGMIVARATEGGDAEDGIYVVPASGAASRHSEFDDYDDLPGLAIRVVGGTDHANTEWRVTSGFGGTIDTDPVTIEPLAISGSGGGAVEDRDALKALNPDNITTVYLAEDGREGWFRWNASDLSASVAADTEEGIYVAPASDDTGESGAWVRQYSGPVSVRWFGAVADGETDDKTAIHAARDMAIAEGKGLHFPAGNYAASNLAFVQARLRVTFDPGVELFHLDTGVFITIGSNPGSYREVYFGWGCPPVITGNTDTTDLVQIYNCHESYFDVICRECVTGVRASFCILSHFNVHCSTNSGEISVLVPDHALYLTGHDPSAPCVACQVYVLAEGLQDYGLYLDNAQHCEILGVSEGNAGGVYSETGSTGNSFRGFYTESCTTLGSLLKGHRAVLDNCSAHGDKWTIEGNFCRITGGFYTDFEIATGATDNTIEGTYVINGLVDNGTRTYKRNTGQIGVTGSVRPTITGSKGGNAALTSLLSQLAAYGYIIDNTT